MEWLAMTLPILAVIILWVFFRDKTVWWEAAIPIAAIAIFILIFKTSAEWSMTRDTEYWTGYVTKTEYYEDWNERVSCRHPRYCTRTRTDSKGHVHTETYQCGWMHPYDVDYHPPYWIKVDNNGISNHISQAEYHRLVSKFGNEYFVDLGRNYHTDDGDKYVSDWKGTNTSLESMVTSHTYENRVQASSSVFNFQEVDTADIRKYGLFSYPSIDGTDHQRHILGMHSKSAERKMEILNAKLGKKKEVKAFILVFKDQPAKAAELQEQLWKGGNKNEFILCIGTDKSRSINWVYIISWNDHKILNVNVRDWVLDQKRLNLDNLVDYLYPQINDNFHRENWSDFDYLEVELTQTQEIWLWIVAFILTVGLSVWVVANPIEEERYSYYQRGYNKTKMTVKEFFMIVGGPFVKAFFVSKEYILKAYNYCKDYTIKTWKKVKEIWKKVRKKFKK